MNESQDSMTQNVISYIQDMTYESISEELSQELKRCLVDGIGVMVSGVPAACSRIIQRYVKESSETGESSILGTSIATTPSLAALANGVAGHAEDFDDTQLSNSPDRLYGLLTHPTTPALAGTLAVAQEVKANGKEFLTAFCTGFEVECKIADAISPDHYIKGHHTTGTVGTFAAAAAAAPTAPWTSSDPGSVPSSLQELMPTTLRITTRFRYEYKLMLRLLASIYS